MEMEGERRGQRLVLVPYPGQGHINPMLQLATILHSKGFSITIVHPKFNFPDPSNHPNFTFLPIPADGLLSHGKPLSFEAMLSAINKNCEVPFQQGMERMMEETEAHDRINCIIYDALMYFAQTVADHLKLPGISVRVSSAASVLAFAVSPRLHQQGYIPLQDTISAELDLPELKLGNVTETLLEMRVALTSAMKRSSAIIVNTMDYLEQETLAKVHEYFPVPTFSIGPLHKFAPDSSSSLLKEDTGCISWLDKQATNSVIYVSFGSLASIDEKEYLEVAWGLANSKQPFLWVVRPGSVRGLEWIELLPASFEETIGERGCIVRWAPQKEVLAHNAVGGFWSHCGWNSTLESICEGVPMLCRPFFGDQILNARYVSHAWKLGLELEKSESGEIEKAREMEKQRTERQRRVVLVPCPFQGHISPMLELGTVLHSKGFSITVAHTQFNYPDPSNHPDFMIVPISDGLTDHDTSSGDLIALVSTLNTNCEVPLKECLARMMDQQEQYGQLACIIYDTVMHVSETVANCLKLPTIILRTSGASALVVYGVMPQLQAAGYFPLQDSTLQDLVPELHPLRFKDLPISKFESIEALLQLIAIVCTIRTSSAIIWNTMDCLEQTPLAQLKQQYQIPFFSIGPLFKISSASSSSLLKEDTDCITWLDKQAPNSVIYVSLGSLASMDEKEIAEMAWGLANSGQPFLWVIRPASVRGSEWIELLPEGFKEEIGEKGFIVKWAPQKHVLAHGAVGGFLSHCGWNSTLESISEGVPMICWPCFGDQKTNARYVSHVWKVGLELENMLERGEIERAVRKLMVDTEGREIRQRVIDLKEKIALCMRDGGSSYNSLNDLHEYILSL
ncbi:hypothetical protein F0562_001018 [Nyssa sinensis]|uniref:Uncharacterized protein n=1 Tax=Nyssa sinensis TaxID=561372 RepID=A0A5J5C3E8_9ASTE|nr:hypothetical protein F0562_001018 [Nyssa sinensis]